MKFAEASRGVNEPDSAMAALRWLCEGWGYEVTSADEVQGKHGLLCAFNNHRTRREDIDGFLDDLLHIAEEIIVEQAN